MAAVQMSKLVMAFGIALSATAPASAVQVFDNRFAMALAAEPVCPLSLDAGGIESYVTWRHDPSTLEIADWLDGEIGFWHRLTDDFKPSDMRDFCAEAEAGATALGLKRSEGLAELYARGRALVRSPFGPRAELSLFTDRETATSALAGLAASATACHYEIDPASIERARKVIEDPISKMGADSIIREWWDRGGQEARDFLAAATDNQRLAHCLVSERTVDHFRFAP